MNIDDFVAACNRLEIRKNNLINSAEQFEHVPKCVRNYTCSRLVDYEFQLQQGENPDFNPVDRIINYSTKYSYNFYHWAFERKYLIVKAFLDKQPKEA